MTRRTQTVSIKEALEKPLRRRPHTFSIQEGLNLPFKTQYLQDPLGLVPAGPFISPTHGRDDPFNGQLVSLGLSNARFCNSRFNAAKLTGDSVTMYYRPSNTVLVDPIWDARRSHSARSGVTAGTMAASARSGVTAGTSARSGVTGAQLDALAKGSAGKYNGSMSRSTKSKVKGILSMWADVHRSCRKTDYRFPLVLLTLTLDTDHHNDDHYQVKRKYLNKFLIYLKRRHGVQNYFWRAEPTKTGRLHFHLILDAFIQKETVRDLWNEVTGMPKNNPSTRIESPHGWKNAEKSGLKSLLAYLVKYVTKAADETAPKISGRIWGCSDNLRYLQPYSIQGADQIAGVVRGMAMTMGRNHTVEGIVTDKFAFIKLSPELKNSIPWLIERRERYISGVAKALYSPDYPPDLRQEALLTAQWPWTMDVLIEDGGAHNIAKLRTSVGRLARHVHRNSTGRTTHRHKKSGATHPTQGQGGRSMDGRQLRLQIPTFPIQSA